jgi:hypothetical protein
MWDKDAVRGLAIICFFIWGLGIFFSILGLIFMSDLLFKFATMGIAIYPGLLLLIISFFLKDNSNLTKEQNNQLNDIKKEYKEEHNVKGSLTKKQDDEVWEEFWASLFEAEKIEINKKTIKNLGENEVKKRIFDAKLREARLIKRKKYKKQKKKAKR